MYQMHKRLTASLSIDPGIQFQPLGNQAHLVSPCKKGKKTDAQYFRGKQKENTMS